MSTDTAIPCGNAPRKITLAPL